jgi:hypothetical protein
MQKPRKAQKEELAAFHSSDYVDVLANTTPETFKQQTDAYLKYGIEYDCPIFPGLYNFCSLYTGASIGEWPPSKTSDCTGADASEWGRILLERCSFIEPHAAPRIHNADLCGTPFGVAAMHRFAPFPPAVSILLSWPSTPYRRCL